MVKQLNDCKGLNREVAAVVTQLFNDAVENETEKFELVIPNNLKSIFYTQKEKVFAYIAEKYKDLDPKFKTSELGAGWYNGWNLSKVRQETNGDVPDELIGVRNRKYVKRGFETPLNYRVWVTITLPE